MAIRLLINGQEADLGSNADGLLLFTYGQGDLDAPAIVQNAYSKEVVLPPTQRNAGIFGAWMQTDKVRGTADGFDALARVPFQIRDNGDEVLEAGYVKLESISADGYTLHLFGGLGSFLYGLMYGTDGEKKTLASLTWGALDAALSFNINATIVQDAWNRLQNYAGVVEDEYDIVNFAPMHNGQPADFDSGKALIPVGGAHGCPAVAGEEGVRVGVTEYALAEFGKEFNEWEVRDLRSYLQRPVFNLRALLYALENAANNGGYTFDWSGIASKWYSSLWMTLPMLAVNNTTQGSKTLTLSWYTDEIPDLIAGELLTPISFRPDTPVLEKVAVDMRFRLRFYHGQSGYGYEYGWLHYADFLFLRLIAYDADNNIVSASPVLYMHDTHSSATAAQVAAHLDGAVVTADGVKDTTLGNFSFDNMLEYETEEMTADDAYVYSNELRLTLEGYGFDHLALAVKGANANGASFLSVFLSDDDEYSGGLDSAQIYDSRVYDYASSKGEWEASARVHSGAHISKTDLLGGTASPAEILLSFVKTFGLALRYDAIGKVVSLVERDAFYGGGTEIDLSQRIDHSQPVRVVPNGISEKWLRFAHKDASCTFAEQYAAKYGAQYGAKRVDTGSPFNADTMEVLEGVGFVAGVTGLAYGRYYWRVKDAAVASGLLPSPCLDNNVKYTLWKEISAEAQQHDVAPLTRDASLLPVTAIPGLVAPGYDAAYRLQLDGGGGDGAGILLFYEGQVREYIQLTDDNAAMLNTNEGQPCWMPYLGAAPAKDVPLFLGYSFEKDGADWTTTIKESLDMGTPRELAMPAASYGAGLDIYARAWAAYIADRYGENAHRVTARVDWRGYQIGQDLFRNFYWFDGCWWVLEKMTDYCWNNPQPCECTFVRVMDKGAYTNGQN